MGLSSPRVGSPEAHLDDARSLSRRTWASLKTWLGAALSRKGAVLACTLLLAIVGHDLYVRLAYELAGPLTWDTPIYAAVGRGLANGIPLYRGLFETKPPVIFVLFWLSWRLFGSWKLMTWLQAGVIGAIALFPASLVVRDRAHVSRLASKLVLALLCGGLFALYTAERSGEIQVESFGVAALLPWMWIWNRRADDDTRGARGSFVWAGLSLAVACMTKEPFLLTAIAVALLDIRSRRDLARLAGMLLAAGAIALAVIVVTGLGRDFFVIYLKEMFLHGAAAAGGATANGATRFVEKLDKAMEWGRLWDDLRDFAPASPVLLATAGWVGLQTRHRADEPWLPILARWTAAAILSILAVAFAGSFFNHHFVFAVPVWMSVLCVWILSNHDERPTVPRSDLLSSIAIVALAIGALFHQRPDFGARLASLRRDERAAVLAAAEIDRILDCTGEARFMFLGMNGVQPFGWTSHSPVGPFFFQYDAWFTNPRADAEQRKTLQGELGQARLLVFDDYHVGAWNDGLREAVDARFRGYPPARCMSGGYDGRWKLRWAAD